MKHDYAKKWTVSELSAIQKGYFFEKSGVFYEAIFAHFLAKNRLFAIRPPFLNRW